VEKDDGEDPRHVTSSPKPVSEELISLLRPLNPLGSGSSKLQALEVRRPARRKHSRRGEGGSGAKLDAGGGGYSS